MGRAAMQNQRAMRPLIQRAVAWSVGCWASLGGAAFAQLESEVLLPTDSQFGDAFGSAVATDVDWLACGLPGRDGNFFVGPDVGAVDVYERSGEDWVFAQRLQPGVPAEDLRFGEALALVGDWLFIGTPGSDDLASDSGAVHVYREIGGAWTASQVLHPTQFQANAEFGAYLDAQDDWLIVAAPRADAGAPLSGAAYAFQRVGDQWIERQQLQAPAPQTQGLFSRVSLDLPRLAVGNPTDDQAAIDAGAVDLFELNGPTWSHVQRVLPAANQIQQEFGASVDLDGDDLAVGSPGLAGGRGAIEVYRRGLSQFEFQAELVPSDSGFGDVFGLHLALRDGRLVADATASEQDPQGKALYLFQRFGDFWLQASKFESQDPGGNQGFGQGLAWDGSALWVGAPGADVEVSNAGRVARVELGQALQLLQALTDSVSLSAGGEQVLRLNASPSAALRWFLFLGSASGTTPGTFGAGVTVPLNLDGYFLDTLLSPTTHPVQPALANLGTAGTALAKVVVPAGIDPTLAGLTVHHAYLVVDIVGPQITAVSKAVALQLTE